MLFNTDLLRRTTAVDRFPWLQATVTLIRVSTDGLTIQAKSTQEKKRLLSTAADDDLVLAAWPGQYSQDIFAVDDLASARRDVGVTKASAEPGASQNDTTAAVHALREFSFQRRRGLWEHLAQTENLPPAGQLVLAKRVAGQGWHTDDAEHLLSRSDLDPTARDVLISQASDRIAAALMGHPKCDLEHARLLLRQYPENPGVLDAALKRADIRAEAWQHVIAMPYSTIAAMFSRHGYWHAEGHEQLAEPALAAVLKGTPPPAEPAPTVGFDRNNREHLVCALIARLPAAAQIRAAAHPQHGRLVQRQLLNLKDPLPDDVLRVCLSELFPADAEHAWAGQHQTEQTLARLRRYPQLGELAPQEVGEFVDALPTRGWQPRDAATAGKWDDLMTVARWTRSPDLLSALVKAAVSGRTPLIRHGQPAPPWPNHQPAHQLIQLLLTRPIGDENILHLLSRLDDEHLGQLASSLDPGSPVLSAYEQIDSQRRAASSAEASKTPPTMHQRHTTQPLPTDDQLAADPDRAEILNDMVRRRNGYGADAIDHALNSAHITDNIAWFAPVEKLETHPVFGPRLTTKLIDLCGQSPTRWNQLLTSWGGTRPAQLQAANLFKRIEKTPEQTLPLDLQE